MYIYWAPGRDPGPGRAGTRDPGRARDLVQWVPGQSSKMDHKVYILTSSRKPPFGSQINWEGGLWFPDPESVLGGVSV